MPKAKNASVPPLRPRSTRIIEARARAEAAAAAAAAVAAAAAAAAAAKKAQSVRPTISCPGETVDPNEIDVDQKMMVFFLEEETTPGEIDNDASQAPVAIGSSAMDLGGSASPHANTTNSSGSGPVVCPGFKLYEPHAESSARAGMGGELTASSSSAPPAATAPAATAGGSVSGDVAVLPLSRRPHVGKGGFLAETKDALVRCSEVIRGDDYDLDDEDQDFLTDLHQKDDAGKWILSMNLFEALVEQLERQEARMRDVSAVRVLVLACCV